MQNSLPCSHGRPLARSQPSAQHKLGKTVAAAVCRPRPALSTHHLRRRIMEQQLVEKHTNQGVGSKLPHLADCVYLDYNATTPIFPEVAEAMKPYTYELFGNPSSVHAYGRQTRAAVDKARQQVAALISCTPSEVCFTSCGTESDNWALWGAVMGRGRGMTQGQLPHVVTSQMEHPAVTACLRSMADMGLCTYTAVPVDSQGLVSAADVVAALTPSTVLVSVMHSNNEVGALQPVAAIAAAVRQAAPSCLIHSDAAQSMGKVCVDVRELGVDLLTLVGHKFGAPKGVAALYIRQGTQLANLLNGGSQEAGRRGGTENVVLLAGLGTAAELARSEAAATHAHMRRMRDRLAAGLLAALPQHLVRINGPEEASLQLPNTLSISVKGLSAPSLLQMLTDKLAASAGAACHSSHGPAVSPVLQAMRLHPNYAVGTLRLSTGRHTTPEEVDSAVQLIVGAARKQGLDFSSSDSSRITANGCSEQQH
ncbi:pyridoxal phosphate-dependent transferase [Scenedesmus sp. NREL 46B-D3]|nr:pyridoxal phosphate-dependent transferase [Scenedesmus sp. NREL 46B-D3]